MFKEVDEGEGNDDIFSSVDIQEYWDNIRRTAQAEYKIISDMAEDNQEEKKQDEYHENVISFLNKEKQDDADNPVEDVDDFDDFAFHSPKNEFEQMLHRKIFELNKLQTDFHALQLQNQKEKNMRLKAEETIFKMKRQHATDK